MDRLEIDIGVQQKYYNNLNNCYEKYEGFRGQALVECLSYEIGKILGVKNIVGYSINKDDLGVFTRSKNFIRKGSSQFDSYSVGFKDTFYNSPVDYTTFKSSIKRFITLLRFVDTAFPVTDLMETLWFDYLTLNTDRHGGNIVLVSDSIFTRLSPMFDFGQSFLVGDHSIDEGNVESKIRNCMFDPFGVAYNDVIEYYNQISKFPWDICKLNIKSLSRFFISMRDYYTERELDRVITVLDKRIQMINKELK